MKQTLIILLTVVAMSAKGQERCNRCIYFDTTTTISQWRLTDQAGVIMYNDSSILITDSTGNPVFDMAHGVIEVKDTEKSFDVLFKIVIGELERNRNKFNKYLKP